LILPPDICIFFGFIFLKRAGFLVVDKRKRAKNFKTARLLGN